MTDLKALSEAATPGVWVSDPDPDDTVDKLAIASGMAATDAHLACALVNAFRFGELVPRSEVEAARREALGEAAEFCRNHEVGITTTKGYIIGPRHKLSGGTHPGEAYADALSALARKGGE